jgi:conjugal transfer pilus assembly protein TraW
MPDAMSRSVPTQGRVLDLGTDGPVHPIYERDLAALIRERASQLTTDHLKARLAPAVREYGRRLPGLPPAMESQRRTFEPVITIQDEIRIPGGEVIAPAGTSLRPLQYATVHGRWVFVDTDQPRHMQWAEQVLKEDPSLHIVTVHGDPLDAEDRLHTKVYLAYPTLLERFGVERVPSVVTQVGSQFVIDEVALP